MLPSSQKACSDQEMGMAFSFRIDDVMYIGPGDHCLPMTVIFGRLEAGTVSSGDKIAVPTAGGEPFIRHVIVLDVIHRLLYRASFGEEPIQFGIALRDQPPSRNIVVPGVAVSCE
jgi:hypothetical protein